MPDSKTAATAARAKREGKAPSTQAGAFVKKEIDRIKHKEHGVKSTRQAIAIGLSEARRAGVDMKAPKKATASAETRKKAAHDSEVGRAKRDGNKAASSSESHAKRSRATTAVLKRESSKPASTQSLSSQGHKAASRRSAADRSAAARKGAQTKGAAGRSAAAKKGARTRVAHRAA